MRILGVWTGCPALRAGQSDAPQRSFDVRIRGFQRLGQTKFLFSLIDVAHLAVSEAELFVQIGFDGAVTTDFNGLLKLADSFGPVMCRARRQSIVAESAGLVDDVAFLLHVALAGHQARGVVRIG
jgi:hypothetical protein